MGEARAEHTERHAQSTSIRRKDVEKALLHIWDEYSRRLSSSFHQEAHKPTKNENAKNFLRREIYTLGQRLLEHPTETWMVDDLVDKVRRVRTRSDKRGDVFHALFMCIYEDDDTISRQERWLMAKELEYALLHQVPSELLCGFLYQSGPRTEIPKKIESGYIEPAFRKACTG